jgi:hypothetical protein
MKRWIHIAVVSVSLLATFTPAFAQQVERFVPFDNFIQNVAQAASGEYLGRPGNKVQDAAALDQMRHHILTMYDGVHVSNSFVLDNQHIDCVPIDEQPSVRLGSVKTIATPPPASALAGPSQNASARSTKLTSQFSPGQPFDKFGNHIGCSEGSIPMRRITLEEMSHFSNLKAFFDKGPNGVGRTPQGDGFKAPVASAHKYAYTYQYVDNLGGSSTLNVWRPYVNPLVDLFSLSQEWYSGGTGDSTQTAEVGWQKFPSKYGRNISALFVYYTADNYNKTGCYNLDCVAFVQTNNSWTLGGGFPSYSVTGGAQYEVDVQYYLSGGNWWLSVGGTWVGYYPGTLYGSGQMASNAQSIEFGGETVNLDGQNCWPLMGSGEFANKGYTHAAYQSNIWYRDTNSSTWWAGLTKYEPSPFCYTIGGPILEDGTYFYFGGPGGSGC